ncbi:protein Ycf2-like [Impatiens glandulifera]|uniref:protein Ycf2-like n=1 Tax=Impatiens glandulifera TaxID=253017 RepID=UPI001FB172F3|nr:protein Ycf2-like [Impatiens glandulifera]
MAAIVTSTPVNWSRVLFDVLIWMVGIRSVGLIPQISCLLVELGVPTCPGEGLNHAQQTEDEGSASSSERTDTEKTDDERSANEEENSGQSPDNAGPDAISETTEGSEEGGEDAGDEGGDKDNEEAGEEEADRISLKLLQGAKKRAESIEELYLEWHEHRFGKPYRQILPGYTDMECIQRLKEVEDLIMNLTKSNTIEEITEEFEEVGPEDTLTPRVLERLEKAKGDLIQEIDRLEAIYSQREIPVYTTPRIETSPDHCPTPPRENAASKESDERADPLLTGQSPLTQPEVSESDFTKEWVEGRLQRFEDSTTERIDSRIQEFEVSADELDAEASKEKEAPRSSQLTEEEEEAERIRKAEAKFPGLAKKAAAQAAKDDARLERERRRLESFAEDNKKKNAASSVSAPTKRKREPSKKVQIADLLNEVTDTVITSIPQQAAQVEEEVEEQLQPRSKR